MNGVSGLALVPLSLASIFLGAGALHLIGPRWLRATYERWDYPRGFRFVVGLLELLAALLLWTPTLRGWGIALAAVINFFAVVALLDHRKYLLSLPAMAMMAALVPAALAIPPRSPYEEIAQKQPAPASASVRQGDFLFLLTSMR